MSMEKMVVEATSKLLEGFKVLSKTGKFEIIQDLPQPLGTGEGPSPPALLLSALGACICIVTKFHAEKKGIKIDDIEARVVGELDPRGFMGENVKPGFEKILVEIKVKSPHSENEIKELIKEAEKHCPLADTISNLTEIKVTVTKT